MLVLDFNEAGNEGEGGIYEGKCSGSMLSIDRLSIWSMY